MSLQSFGIYTTKKAHSQWDFIGTIEVDEHDDDKMRSIVDTVKKKTGLDCMLVRNCEALRIIKALTDTGIRRKPVFASNLTNEVTK